MAKTQTKKKTAKKTSPAAKPNPVEDAKAPEVAKPESTKPEAKKSEEPKPIPLNSRQKEKADEVAVFRSYNEEPREFAVQGIRARKSVKEPTRIEWHVPVDQAERFEKHFHVQRGRIIRVKK